MNIGSPMLDKAVTNGVIQKSSIHAVAERMRSFEQRFNEMPRINISAGSLPAHQQVDVQFFQRDQGIELMVSLEDGFLHLRNLTSNTILGMEFETRQGRIELESDTIGRSLSVEKLIVDEGSKMDMPEFADKLSKVVLVDNDGASIDGLQDSLNRFDPKAIFVERSDFNEHFLINSIIGHTKSREVFLNEFEENTGPRALDNSNQLYNKVTHDTPVLEM